VFAALAVSRLVEDRTGWSTKKFVRTARRYRTVQIRAGAQLLTAEDPIPDDLRDVLARISESKRLHQFEPSRGRTAGRWPSRRVRGVRMYVGAGPTATIRAGTMS
jgi:hypothetical protein